MVSRPVRGAARSVVLVFLFALALLVLAPLKNASAHEGLPPKTLPLSNALPQSQLDIAGPAGSVSFGTFVTVLPNGNFVVADPYFSEGGAFATGAVYLYSGTTRTIISTLKGGTENDRVGSEGVVVLANGNYVVRSPNWNNPVGPKTDAGAATWCSATTGCNGAVSAANSLIGGTASDQVGSRGVTALANGHYVVVSPMWDNPAGPIADAGAVTWGNGNGGTTGLVTTANSLYGGSANDGVGYDGIIVLTNGNYVVKSPNWDNPVGPKTDAGAATWCSATAGCNGAVSAINSLIGGSANDLVGAAGVVPLTNSNYIVVSPMWDNPAGPRVDAGAVTWGNGTSGITGLVSGANSLIGGSANDLVGGYGATALTNGNYVVPSLFWDNPTGPIADAGAVTWGNGASGTKGLVTTANSLYGGTASDQIGSRGVIALANGNYVVRSPSWDDPVGPAADVGAVTWGSGKGGTVGLVTASNSLHGSMASDWVGSGGVTALTNGGYVVASPSWDNPMGSIVDAGAVTWGNGNGGTTGLVSGANSLIGGSVNDQIGSFGVTALTNGSYVVVSPMWDNLAGPLVDAGAATWGNGTSGVTGLISASNSLVGMSAYDHVGNYGVTALTNGNYVVTSSTWHDPAGPVADLGAVTWGNGMSGTSGLVTPLNSLIGGTAYDQIGNGGVTALTNGSYIVASHNWDNPAGPVTDAGAVTWIIGNGSTTGLISSANSVLGTVTNGVSTFSYDATRNRLFVGRGASDTVSILNTPSVMLPLIMR